MSGGLTDKLVTSYVKKIYLTFYMKAGERSDSGVSFLIHANDSVFKVFNIHNPNIYLSLSPVYGWELALTRIADPARRTA